MRTSLVTRLGEVLLFASLLSALGCSGKDATKCQEALDGTRKSLAAGDYNLTGQWRSRAYGYCADKASLSALDKQIVDQQASEAAAKSAEAERKATNSAVLKLFTQWAGDNRAAPDKAASAPKCDGDDAAAGTPAAAEAKTKDRLCTATRSAGATALTARYWEADKTIEMFSVTPPGPVSCDDLGPNKALKTWGVASTSGQPIARTRCELSSGALSGMTAVVSAANNAPVYIFSASYLEKDPSLKKIAGE
ncbi:MAG TPA: hypothetical protein VGM44_03320 [Polyangiaceae bacterium]|jgi:hypothetical protein